MIRNVIRLETKLINYSVAKIEAWLDTWEEFNHITQKWEIKKQIFCRVYPNNPKNKPLNLGECNDGSKFTAINQAINQAKSFIDCCITLKLYKN